ncbi:hypothetical protein ALP92_05022, partial [Pseudomonas syringae pv. primulae]
MHRKSLEVIVRSSGGIAGSITWGVVMLNLINNVFLKQDSVGWWLRKCCWSRPLNYRYAETADGEHEEVRALMEIQLSPQVHVKSAMHYENRYLGKGDHYSVAVQNGAGVQVRLPNLVRGQSVHFNIVSTKRPWGVLPVAKIDDPLHEAFLD